MDNLVSEASKGSQSAFASLWRHFYPKMLRYLSMFTRDAEDVCSEVWIKIARAIKGFIGDSKGFQGWIFTIARNAATDHSRVKKRSGTMFELKEGDWVEEDPSMAVVTSLLNQLPKDQAEVIMLRVVVGMDVDVVASLTGKSPANVRVLSHRGLAQLKESLGGAR